MMLLKLVVTDFSQQGADFTDPPIIKKTLLESGTKMRYSALTIN